MRASIPPNLKRSAPSLRTRIFVGLALAIVLALAGQIAFGYTSFRRLIESEIAEGCAWSRQQIHRLLQRSSRTTQPHIEQHQQAVRHHRQIA